MISKQRGRKTAGKVIKSRLADLMQNGVTSRNWNAVRRYIEKHSSVVSLLPVVFQQVRKEFGRITELALDEYRDPEFDDRYLILSVRLANYGIDTMDRIEGVNQSFEDRITPSSGYLLVTTDFQPPG